MTVQRLDIDMIPGGAVPEIRLSKGDCDFRLVFPLHASSGALQLESNTTAAFVGTLPNGSTVSVNATLDPAEPSVTVQGTDSLTAVPGTGSFSIRLTHSGKSVYSPRIALIIEPSPA